MSTAARVRESGGRKPVTRPRRRFGAGFREHQDVAVDSLARLLAEPGASLLTVAAISIALALPLCLFLLLQNLREAGAGLDEAATFSLFMQPSQSVAELEELRGRLLARPDVAAVTLITPEDALAEFRAQSGFGAVLEELEDNPLPPVLAVGPAVQGAAALEALARDLGALPGVDHAQLDLQWLQRLQAVIDLARRLTLGLAALLCVGVVLATGNTVRLIIENRRAEILVVKLVGGTDAYVARPFLYAGLWYGVGGGLIAGALVATGLWGLQGPVTRLAGLYGSDFSLSGLPPSGFLLLALGGGLLGWFGAWLSVLRHLRLIEPR